MTNIYNNHLISDKTMEALEGGSGMGFSDFWGISEHEETDPGMCLEVGGVSHQVLAKPESAETEAGMLCDEGLFPDSKKPSTREKDKCVCAYCKCSLQNWVPDQFCSDVQQCNVLSKLMSCPDCNTDMAKMTVSERRTHVQTCQNKQADAFLTP